MPIPAVLFLCWFFGSALGALILTGMSDSFAREYWYLFTVLWPVGVPVFLLWASVRTYHLIKDICLNLR